MIGRFAKRKTLCYNEMGDGMALQRIDKILSSQGVASRSEIKQLIRAGRITANGAPVKRPEEKFDPESTVLTLDGETVRVRKYLYIMMNKPSGVLSASMDKNAITVLDLLPKESRREGMFPAGRLDKDTTGLILLTDDGELGHRMLSPKKHVYKLYSVECDKVLCQEDVLRFSEGISSGDDCFLPAAMKITGDNNALVEICEGKFHQIKRMFHAIGAEVTALKRLRIGGVYLDDSLSEGEWRELTDEEITLITDSSIKELT